MLETKDVRVVGYVTEKKINQITLSYTDPNSQQQNNNNDRTYLLKRFNAYQILEEPEVEEKEEEKIIVSLEEGSKQKPLSCRVGDIIILKYLKQKIVGYVEFRGTETIELAHLDPNSLISGIEVCQYNYSKGWVKGQGNSEYIIKNLLEGNVLLKAKDYQAQQKEKQSSPSKENVVEVVE